MIKRIAFIVFCCLACIQTPIVACDVCGCGASNMGAGLLTNYRSSFIRLGYYNTQFSGQSAQDYSVSDKFQQLELAMRYAINDRIRIMAHVPYGFNSREIPSTIQRVRGLADFRVTGSYAVFNNKSIGKRSNLYLELGTGFSVPSGKFDAQIHDRNLPENFNIGRGSMGYIFQMNTVWSQKQFGLVFSNNYQLNSATSSGYQFGNQFNTQVTVFRDLDLKKSKFVPNLGLGVEKTSKDHYANDRTVAGTGGTGVFLTTGLNFQTNTWLAGINYALPLKESYSDGAVSANGRFSCQVSFLF